jgi:hypothetical protein
MTVSTTDLLELLAYAGELDLSIFVREDEDGDYVVKFYELYTNNFDERVVINKEGISCGMGGEGGNQSFNDMVSILNGMLKKKKEEKLKAQKRQELLTRLTTEELELLGVVK